MLKRDGTLVYKKAQAVISSASGALCGGEERGFRRLIDCVVGAGECGKIIVWNYLLVAFFQAKRCSLNDQVSGLAMLAKGGVRESEGADFGGW